MDERGYHDEAEGWDPAGNWCGECLRATCQDCIVWLLKKYDRITDYPLAPYEKAIVERYKAEQEYYSRCREKNAKKKKGEPMNERCPICGYEIKHCQCMFIGSAHPNRDLRQRVVLDHLYLFTPAQIDHIIQLEKKWYISYADNERSGILESIEKEIKDGTMVMI